jgi:aspartate racemase
MAWICSAFAHCVAFSGSSVISLRDNKGRQGGVTIKESKTLGLVAGLGVGAGIFYYRSLVNAHLARGLSPRIVTVHADVRKVMILAQAKEKHQLAQYLAGLLQQLAGAGADVATIPAFSPQVCADELQEITPLPLISLLGAMVTETKRRQLRRVAILGARVTMETELFGRLKGIAEVISLSPAESEKLGAIYTGIVENESASPTELETLKSAAHRFIERGADAVLLAGTDFSFVFCPDTTDFPHLDGARTHIEAIMRAITGG